MGSNNSNHPEPTRRSLHKSAGSGKGGNGRHRVTKRVLKWALGIFVTLFVLGTAVFFIFAAGAPQVTQAELQSDNATQIYDMNNKLVSSLGAQDRDYVKSANIPAQLKAAVVSVEDRRFYKHIGVDPFRIVGAAFANVTGSSLGLQGGSTLTQQLVKLSVFSTAKTDQTLKRKAQEAWLAINVERHYSKQQILEFYINKVYMGNGVYGMETAAQYYYGTSLSQLNLSQLATLAGMPQSPSNYNPIDNPTLSTSRRNTVLAAMVQNKQISQADANQAKQVNVTTGLDAGHGDVTDRIQTDKVYDSYLKEVVTDIKSKGYNPDTDGLKVYTNLDTSAQQRLYDINNTSQYVTFPDGGQQTLQVGAAVVNAKNGKITAMLGGRKTGDVVFGLNRAVQSDRSNGSTMKPLMDYAPAIEYKDYPTFHSVSDTAYTYPGTDKKLMDFDNAYLGTMTMREALVQSRNIPAIKTLADVGISNASEFLSGMGITSKNGYTLQNGIGGYVSPLQMAAAYATFANGGTYHKPYYINKITTAGGETKTYSTTSHRAMKSSTAYMITDMLKGVINSSNGTGTTANLSGVYQAGKTGTTAYPSDFKDKVPSGSIMDSSFSGYTKNYAISIWTGFDKHYQSGGYLTPTNTKIAAQIYKNMQYYLSNEYPSSDWSKPDSVTNVYRNGVKELAVTDSKWASGYGPSSSYSSTSSATRDSRNEVQSSSSTSTSSASSDSSSESNPNAQSSSSSTTSSSASSSSTPPTNGAPNNPA